MTRVMRVAMLVLLIGAAAGCYRPYHYDFDNDHRADFVVVTATGAWIDLAKPSSDPPLHVGGWQDWVVPANYDQAGGFEPATIDAEGNWITAGTAGTIAFPAPPQIPAALGEGSYRFTMIPVPGDYDGDHRADPAWYRDSDGTWFIRGQDPITFGDGPTSFTFTYGANAANDVVDQDFPVPADYDGDGTTDLAVYNPRTRVWRVRSSADGTVSSVTMPGAQDVVAFPAPGSYDDPGHAQRALFGWEGWWIDGHPDPVLFGNVARSPDDYYGNLGSVTAPAVADYDGDGLTDLSYVSTYGVWTTRSSADPATVTAYSTGVIGSGSNSWPVPFRGALSSAVARFTLVAWNCVPPPLPPPGQLPSSDC